MLVQLGENENNGEMLAASAMRDGYIKHEIKRTKTFVENMETSRNNGLRVEVFNI